jgi:hypothetical protein
MENGTFAVTLEICRPGVNTVRALEFKPGSSTQTTAHDPPCALPQPTPFFEVHLFGNRSIFHLEKPFLGSSSAAKICPSSPKI